MDSLFKNNRSILILLLSFLLAACGNQTEDGRDAGDGSFRLGSHLEPEPLQIIGFPPDRLYYDVLFEAEYAGAGGDGEYRFRFIRNPLIEDDLGRLTPASSIDMTMEVNENSPNPSIFLRAVPEPDDGGGDRLAYGIELTDGTSTITRTFEFSLRTNRLQVSRGSSISVSESTGFDELQIMLNSNLPRERICNGDNLEAYQERVLPDGRVVVPNAFQVFLELPSEKRIEVFYRVVSDYSDGFGEREEQNAGLARPNVDFISEIRSVVFEPGETACVVIIETIDDAIIEGRELMSLEFFDSSGGQVGFKDPVVEVRLFDDEPAVLYTGAEMVRNVDDVIVSKVNLNVASERQVQVNVGFDSFSSTLTKEHVRLVPDDGNLVFAPGETEKTFAVSFDEDMFPSSLNQDGNVTFRLDVESIYEFDPLDITVNEWADDKEIIDVDAAELPVSMISDVNQNIFVGLTNSSEANTYGVVKGYDREGSPLNLSAGQNIEIKQSGINIQVLHIDQANNGNKLIVVAAVDGLVGAQHAGGTDFAVYIFDRQIDGTFVLGSVNQYGTEEDDIVLGATASQSDLYVWGSSAGKLFEGNPSLQVNRGQEDGFVYRLNASTGAKAWSSFVGTSFSDRVRDIAVAPRQLLALLETTQSGVEVSVASLTVNEGVREIFDEQIEINVDGLPSFATIDIDNDARNFYILADTTRALNTNQATASGTREVAISNYSFGTASPSFTAISSDEDDYAVKILPVSDGETFIVAGETEGVISDLSLTGGEGGDAFISFLDVSNPGSVLIDESVQFGTRGEDKIIDILELSEKKFMVLWSDDFTSGDGSLTYRITPFSIDATKLTPEL